MRIPARVRETEPPLPDGHVWEHTEGTEISQNPNIRACYKTISSFSAPSATTLPPGKFPSPERHSSPQKSRLGHSPLFFSPSQCTEVVLNKLRLHLSNWHYQKCSDLVRDLILNRKGPEGILEGSRAGKVGGLEDLSCSLQSR